MLLRPPVGPREPSTRARVAARRKPILEGAALTGGPMFIARQALGRQGGAMPAGLSVAIALLVQAGTAPAYGPPAPAPPATRPAAKKVEESCASAPHKPDQIVVCAQKPQGYRLNPDVIE